MSGTNATSKQSSMSSFTTHPGTTVPFDSIQEPGAYIFNCTGHLLRIPEDGVTLGRSPMINIVAQEPIVVTKISDNPYETVTKARLLASNFDLPVNF